MKIIQDDHSPSLVFIRFNWIEFISFFALINLYRNVMFVHFNLQWTIYCLHRCELFVIRWSFFSPLLIFLSICWNPISIWNTKYNQISTKKLSTTQFRSIVIKSTNVQVFFIHFESFVMQIDIGSKMILSHCTWAFMKWNMHIFQLKLANRWTDRQRWGHKSVVAVTPSDDDMSLHY